MTDIDWSEIDRIKEAYSTRGAHTTSVCLRAIEALKAQVALLEKRYTEEQARTNGLAAEIRKHPAQLRDAVKREREEILAEVKRRMDDLHERYRKSINNHEFSDKYDVLDDLADFIKARSEADHG